MDLMSGCFCTLWIPPWLQRLKLLTWALFTVASAGKTKIFKLLHREVCKITQGPDLKTFLESDNKSTILHKAVLSRNYWLAREIAVRHPHLITEDDGDEMTPLQLLSCSLPFGPKSYFMCMIYKGLHNCILHFFESISVFG
ncbi:hypothetical protein Hdeb2414_s0001g00020811 [Helianthus debilis subsp. tardiflorus]